MKDDILDLIAQAMIESRLGSIVQKNGEYQKALAEEGRVYEQLYESFTEEQKEQFNDFITETTSRTAAYERLSYQQGMKDLLSLMISLLDI